MKWGGMAGFESVSRPKKSCKRWFPKAETLSEDLSSDAVPEDRGQREREL